MTQATCYQCNGTGQHQGAVCDVCGGDGVVTANFELTYTQGLTIDAKVDDIIAEQASQRTDLTAALTQIWNKVKDL